MAGKVCSVGLAFAIPFSLGFDSIRASDKVETSSPSPAEAWVDRQTGFFGDQGDGTYRNPILAMDYSDPDVIRVGADYYMISSTFESSPGIQILHSRDLVNWTTIGAAFADLGKVGPDFSHRAMNNYGFGFYAPSIRYHDGTFYIFANGHREGLYVATAKNPRGPWKVRQIIDRSGEPLRIYGWTDPCPFWDDDGNAYLVTSHPRGAWYSYMFRMTQDGGQLLDADAPTMHQRAKGAPALSGTVYWPHLGSEGTKIYKRNGYYYIITIKFLDGDLPKGTYILRSRHLYGTKADGTAGGPGDPGAYEMRRFGPGVPGQGGLVDTPDGRWFLIAQGPNDGPEGRVPHLLPVSWLNDWPIPGVLRNGVGAMAWQLPKPIADGAPSLPALGDDFSASRLAPMWFWNHQPRPDRWSLTERKGFLRLHAFPQAKPGFFGAGNSIAQHFPRSMDTAVTVRIDIGGFADGQEGGLAHFNGGKNFMTIGVVQSDGKKRLVYTDNGVMEKGPALSDDVHALWLRSTVAFDAVNRFSYSLDGRHFTDVGGTATLKSGNWRGDMVGVYTFNALADKGHMDVDQFDIRVRNRP